MVQEALIERPRLVAIGGSAGAIEVLTVLLPHVPKDAPPVVVVLHLSPRAPSLLSRIFAPRCQGVCMEIEDKTAVETGHVYFAPPGYHVLLEEPDTFALSVDEPVHHSRPSIDVLFESVARTLGKHALGIALTGANQDGAAGLLALHQRGARTVVQTPESAKAPALPVAALRLHTPTFSGPPEAIAAFLAREVAEGAVA